MWVKHLKISGFKHYIFRLCIFLIRMAETAETISEIIELFQSLQTEILRVEKLIPVKIDRLSGIDTYTSECLRHLLQTIPIHQWQRFDGTSIQIGYQTMYGQYAYLIFKAHFIDDDGYEFYYREEQHCNSPGKVTVDYEETIHEMRGFRINPLSGALWYKDDDVYTCPQCNSQIDALTNGRVCKACRKVFCDAHIQHIDPRRHEYYKRFNSGFLDPDVDGKAWVCDQCLTKN